MHPENHNDRVPGKPFALTDSVKVLDPHGLQAELTQTEGLVVRHPEFGERLRVNALPCYPITDRDRFIIFTDEDGDELGVIEELDALSTDSKEAVVQALNEQHFLPLITRVLSISREFYIPTWEVETDRGSRTFACKGRHAAQRMGDGRYYVRDADGNGYLIPDITKLDPASRRLIEINT